jgi:hypothetical protein
MARVVPAGAANKKRVTRAASAPSSPAKVTDSADVPSVPSSPSKKKQKVASAPAAVTVTMESVIAGAAAASASARASADAELSEVAKVDDAAKPKPPPVKDAEQSKSKSEEESEDESESKEESEEESEEYSVEPEVAVPVTKDVPKKTLVVEELEKVIFFQSCVLIFFSFQNYLYFFLELLYSFYVEQKQSAKLMAAKVGTEASNAMAKAHRRDELLKQLELLEAVDEESGEEVRFFFTIFYKNTPQSLMYFLLISL